MIKQKDLKVRLLTFGWNMFSDGKCYWCHISNIHAAQVIMHYCAHLNVKSVEWQLRVPCVGCRGLYRWLITVTCWSWQSLSTPWETLEAIYWIFSSGNGAQKSWQPWLVPFPACLGGCGFCFGNFMMRVSSRPSDAGRNMFLNNTRCCRCQRAFHWRHLSLEKLGELYYRVIFWTFTVLENTTVTFANANNSK